MSGGTDRLQYHASTNVMQADGTLVGNTFTQGGISMKLSRYVSDNFLIRVNLYSTLKKNVEGKAGVDPFEYAVFANPYEQPYNVDGSFAEDKTYIYNRVRITSPSYDTNYQGFNILRELSENTLTNMYSNVRGQLSLEYKFLKNFRYIGTGVLDYTSVHDMEELKPGSYLSWTQNWLNAYAGGRVLPEYNLGSIEESLGRTFNYTVRNSLEFNKKFKKHLVQLFAANEFSANTNYRFSNFMPIYQEEYRMAGYPQWEDIHSEGYDLLNLKTLGSTYFKENRAVSFISSAVYSYDDRYVFNGNWRWDGVDIIGSDNQFTPLWSAGLRWNAHNEYFVKDNLSHLFDRLSLSFGYGFTGSINRSVYPFDTYSLGSQMYNGEIFATSFNWGNPVLKWEKKEDLNVALELSMLKGRVNFEGQFFRNTITDLLDNKRLAPSIGRLTASVNNGSLTNTGWELSTRLEVFKRKDWLVEIGGNVTYVNNDLEDVYEKLPPSLPVYTPQNVESYPVNSWFGYKFSHVDPITGHAMVWAQYQTTDGEGGPLGDALIDLSDISYDELTSLYRPYQIGQSDPKWFGGFNTRVVYKSFDVSAHFVYAAGNQIIGFEDRREGPNSIYSSDVFASRTNRTVNNQNRWRQAGDITDIPKYSNMYTNYQMFLLDTDLEDGSYLKCTQLSFGWRAKPAILDNSAIKKLKVNLVASNLFTLTKYTGTDPETRTPFGYPNTPNVALSLTIGF